MDIYLPIKCLIYWRVKERSNMKINLFGGLFEFDFDWKAVVGVGIIILGCALLTM